jgi:molybdenum cofactor cytidylyltransferase
MRLKKPTAGVVMAAGASRRFGSSKQLLSWRGRTLLEIALEAALNSQLHRVVLVLGHHFADTLAAVARLVDHPRLNIIENKAYRFGQSQSLQAGLSIVRHAYPSVMFLPADQPLMTSSLLDQLLNRYWASDKDIGVPFAGGQAANPTIFSQHFYPDLLQLRGDVGGREIIRRSTEHVIRIDLEDPICLMDIDTPADLEKLNAMARFQNGSPSK